MEPIIKKSQYALMLHMIPHLGPKGIYRLLDNIKDLRNPNINLNDLHAWNLSFDSLKKEYKLHPKAAYCIANNKLKLIEESELAYNAINNLNISIITMLDSDYPSDLKEYYQFPPPILYVYGNLSLLNEKKYAVVNSSDMSPTAVEKTRQISSVLANEKYAVVTSHNTYSYQISGLAAKSLNSPIIMVLDRGILNVFPNGMSWQPIAQARIWNLRFDPSKDLVLSSFRLYDHWIGSNSKERDKLVFALADIVVGVEIRSGGVMESECIYATNKGREVYIYKPKSNIKDGNQNLINYGLNVLPDSYEQPILQTIQLTEDDGIIEYEYSV